MVPAPGALRLGRIIARLEHLEDSAAGNALRFGTVELRDDQPLEAPVRRILRSEGDTEVEPALVQNEAGALLRFGDLEQLRLHLLAQMIVAALTQRWQLAPVAGRPLYRDGRGRDRNGSQKQRKDG